MTYLKTVKPPAVRLVQGSEPGQFFRDAAAIKGELERLIRK
jgi:hypothetical protein